MKISELDSKDYLGTQGVGANSYLIMNYDTEPAPFGEEDTNPTITYKVVLDEIGRALINDLKLVQYDTSNGQMLNTLNGGTEAYTNVNIGQFVNATDRVALNNAITDLQYDTTNKKFVKKTYDDASFTDIVSTANILNDMNLNITQISNTAGKTVATIDEASGKVSATFQDINIVSTQVTDRSDAINSSSHDTVATSKAVKDAIESLDITAITNTAGKTVASITEADGKVGATFQDISILSSQISDRGTAGNVATLDENGHVPASQLPSYVDDVLEGTLATFPATGESGKIYVDTATNTSYRWSGSQYTKVASDLSLGETSSTAYRGDYGAAAYAHGITNKGSAFTSNLYKITTNSEGHVTAATAVTSTDITNLFGKAIVLTDDSRLSDARNAADVSAWAKAATKPTYTASEVGALPDDTEIPDITGLAPLEEPVFTNSITIGETTLTEAQLQALLALLE